MITRVFTKRKLVLNVNILFKGLPEVGKSMCLEEISNMLAQEFDIPVKNISKDADVGVKDGGLTVALSLTGITLSAICTILTALSYWRSKKSNYSVSVFLDNKTITIDNINPKDIDNKLSELEYINSSKIEIIIDSKENS